MHTEAIIIKRSLFREHDQLMVLYAPGLGRIQAAAKSSLKSSSRQAPALDEGNLISCELVPGRTGVDIITGAQTQRSWSTAKSSPLSWAVAQFFLQVIDTIVYPGQGDVGIWEVLMAVLESLDAGQDPLLVFREGQLALLHALGYGSPMTLPQGTFRTSLDDDFERIAQRRLQSLSLIYELATR
jgi:recombinational DNA repair protein (RecF pathway)